MPVAASVGGGAWCAGWPRSGAAAMVMTADSDDGGVERDALVDAARRGDRGAFGRLYELYARMVHGILLARVPRSDADDLVQDVFVLALRKLHTLRDGRSFGAWLAMIARRSASDYHRRSHKRESLPQDLPGDDPAIAEAAEILEVIRGLPESYRETLILRLVEGLSGPEIAARTELTPGSVRVNLHRGMKMLREKLGVQEPV